MALSVVGLKRKKQGQTYRSAPIDAEVLLELPMGSRSKQNTQVSKCRATRKGCDALDAVGLALPYLNRGHPK